jgi:hypothetical protein
MDFYEIRILIYFMCCSSTAVSVSPSPSSVPAAADAAMLPEKGSAEQEHSSSMAIFFVLAVLGMRSVMD